MKLKYDYFAVPPMIWIQNQLVGAMEGQQITLECHSEAYPKSINYWTKDSGNIISQGERPEPIFVLTKLPSKLPTCINFFHRARPARNRSGLKGYKRR